ncbi:MAG: hypothetical protein AAF628_35055 [Planctomycetota bacterium]
MSPLQFALFFAALLICYVLVHLRLTKFETYLREISGLRLLNERLQGVSDALKRVTVDGVEARLDQIAAELVQIRTLADRLERAAPVRAPVEVESESRESGAERLRREVIQHLEAAGYRNVRIVTAIGESESAEPLELAVECDRQQIAHKGKVLTAAGAVADVRLRSVTQSFP